MDRSRYEQGFLEGYRESIAGQPFGLANKPLSSHEDYAQGYYEGFDAGRVWT